MHSNQRGGWVTAHVLADPDLANNFTCAAIAHPNITLEDRIFGGNTAELFNRIQKPLLLIPTRVSAIKVLSVVMIVLIVYDVLYCNNNI